MATTENEQHLPASPGQKRLKPTSFDDTCYQIQLHEHLQHEREEVLQLDDDDSVMHLTPRSAAGGKLKRSHSFSDLQQKSPSAPQVQVLTEGHLTDVEMLVEESAGNEVEGDDAFLRPSTDKAADADPMSPRMPFYGKLLRGMQKSLRVIFRCVNTKSSNGKGEEEPEVKMQSIPPAAPLLTQMASADEEVSIRQKIKAAASEDDDEMNTFVIDVPLTSSKVANHFYYLFMVAAIAAPFAAGFRKEVSCAGLG
jgi:hypothetical protein